MHSKPAKQRVLPGCVKEIILQAAALQVDLARALDLQGTEQNAPICAIRIMDFSKYVNVLDTEQLLPSARRSKVSQ